MYYILIFATITLWFNLGQAQFITYDDVQKITCEQGVQSFTMDLENQVLKGVLKDQKHTYDLTNQNTNLPAQNIELMVNFLESGLDIWGGVVVTTDQETSFGTLGLLVDKPLTQAQQEMWVIYVEAMTGYQINLKMNCLFE